MAESYSRQGPASKKFDCGVPIDRCIGRKAQTNKGADGMMKVHGSFEEARRCQRNDERTQNANAAANGGRIWYSKPRACKPGKSGQRINMDSTKWRSC